MLSAMWTYLMVVDGFMGSGTTIIECKLLGRNAIGYDINPFAVKLTEQQLEIIDKERKNKIIKLPPSNIIIKEHDVKLKHIPDNHFDLICTHPPYFNSIMYSNKERDLSQVKKIKSFLWRMSYISTSASKIKIIFPLPLYWD